MTEREKCMTLDELDIGQSGRITDVGGQGALRQHFLDMGLIPGADVTLVKFAPMGDPMELQIHGYELTLRLADAAQIGVIPIRSAKEQTRGTGRDLCRLRASRLRRGGTVPHQGRGASSAGEYHADLCTGGQPELRQNHAVQSIDRRKPACGQFPRCNGGSEERSNPGLS